MKIKISLNLDGKIHHLSLHVLPKDLPKACNQINFNN